LGFALQQAATSPELSASMGAVNCFDWMIAAITDGGGKNARSNQREENAPLAHANCLAHGKRTTSICRASQSKTLSGPGSTPKA